MNPEELVLDSDHLLGWTKTDEAILSDEQCDLMRAYISSNIEPEILNPFTAMDKDERRKKVNEVIKRGILRQILMTPERRGQEWATVTPELIDACYSHVVGLGVLQPLLDDETVTSITVIQYDCILYEQNSQDKLSLAPFASKKDFVSVVKNLAIRGGQQLTPEKPIADLAFPPPNVVRIHLNISPVVPQAGAFIALRRGRGNQTWRLETLMDKGMFDQAIIDFLRELASVPASIIVGGVPKTGKTTLLEVFLNEVADLHIHLIEESPELNPSLNSLVSRSEVPAGSDTITLATLIKASLRKNVQVVVVGETRGSEAGWLLAGATSMQAMLTTLHGKTSEEVIARMRMNAQIDDKEQSPFARQKDLALEMIVAGFDFIFNTQQLASGRLIIKSIDYISHIDGEKAILVNVFSAKVETFETERGPEQNVTWVLNPDWQMPPILAESVRMANLRKRVRLAGNQAEINVPKWYQAAVLATSHQDYEQAVELYTKILREIDNYQDAESRLLKILQQSRQFTHLEVKTKPILNAIEWQKTFRHWPVLEDMLQELDRDILLRTVIKNKKSLNPYWQILNQGKNADLGWGEVQRDIEKFRQSGEYEEALKKIRSVDLSLLSPVSRAEVVTQWLHFLSHAVQYAQKREEQTLAQMINKLLAGEIQLVSSLATSGGLYQKIVQALKQIFEQIGQRNYLAALNSLELLKREQTLKLQKYVDIWGKNIKMLESLAKTRDQKTAEKGR